MVEVALDSVVEEVLVVIGCLIHGGQVLDAGQDEGSTFAREDLGDAVLDLADKLVDVFFDGFVAGTLAVKDSRPTAAASASGAGVKLELALEVGVA